MMSEGVRIDPKTGKPIEVENELDNYYTCKHCGKSVDMRIIGDIIRHSQTPCEVVKHD